MIYFSSDHHFYHNNVIKYCDRPYSSVEEMNENLVLKWNSVVSDEDLVYYLGDFSLAKRAVELFVPRLNGTKILIAGNHDFCHPSHPKGKTPEKLATQVEYYSNYFDSVVQTTTLTLAGTTFALSHHPYLGDVTPPDKYEKYRLDPKLTKMPLICGHVHEKWTTKKTACGLLQINVGVDRHQMTPVSEIQLLSIYEANK